MKKFGKLMPDETFALKIETALGGQLDLENLYKTQQIPYLVALGKIARQLHGMKPGARKAILRQGGVHAPTLPQRLTALQAK